VEKTGGEEMKKKEIKTKEKKKNILFCSVCPSGIEKCQKAVNILEEHHIEFNKIPLIADCMFGKYIDGGYINCEIPWFFATNGSKYAGVDEIAYYARTRNSL